MQRSSINVHFVGEVTWLTVETGKHESIDDFATLPQDRVKLPEHKLFFLPCATLSFFRQAKTRRVRDPNRRRTMRGRQNNPE